MEAFIQPLSHIDGDELDVMELPIISAPPKLQTTSEESVRRSSRVRQPPKRYTTPENENGIKRKRNLTSDTSGVKKKKIDEGKVAIQKAAMGEKKANTQIVVERRAERDARRSQWMLRHRELIQPLLPTSSNLLSSLESSHQPSKIPYTPYHELEEQPQSVSKQLGEMKDYQLLGLSFLVYMYKNGMNCLLGDEMGLGKTLQTLSLFAWIKENTQGPLEPHLVICPLSVLSSWEAEASRWLPTFKVERFYGSSANERHRLRNSVYRGLGTVDIVLTTYEQYVSEDTWFKTRRWTYCVLDEAHRIKNAGTNVAHKLQHLGALYRLILTGTPVQNDLFELWSLFHYLYPSIFTPTSEQLFRDSFDISKGSYSLPFVSATKKFLSKIMLRRTKASIQLDIPPRVEHTIFIPLTEAQRFWYYRLLTRMDSTELQAIFNEVALNSVNYEGRREVLSMLQNYMACEKENRGTGNQNQQWKKLMNLLLQLRKVCDHPYLLKDAEPDPYHIGEHVVASSSKLIVIDKILADVLPKGEKVLIFAQWYSMLDVLEDMLHLRGINYARLDGSTRRPRRNLDIKLFQHESSNLQVYLISTKAGGLGINLTRASTVILADSDWNPQNDLQAIARAHRIGQKKTVNVYRLICGGSVEDQMLDRIRRKLFLSVKLMGSDNTPVLEGEESSMKSSELMDILRKGSSALSHDGAGMDLGSFLAAPFSKILEESQSKENARDAKLKHDLKEDGGGDQKLIHDAEEEEKRLLSGIAAVRCRLFEGKLVERKAKEGGEPFEVLEKGKRRVEAPKEVIQNNVAPVKKLKQALESQDFCNHCADGGDLIICSFCPRVFHRECRGLTQKEVKTMSFIACSQHACWDCRRRTSDAGYLLFRCRTCPRALCEDCLEDPFQPIDEFLPEFELLGHNASPGAYFIYCKQCLEQSKTEPKWWEEWMKESRKVEEALERKYAQQQERRV
ncbi:hypothetical protein E1B28_003522 [Marasmius oreades]|uniref:Uncharacterized protein n=1 Tax=Marasmius oreades TaxID=181124 RepID=A0A9P7UNH9_9AGAR|nr:uncharacterized protein E1B28_003522 [Marasmius oreades]KAG7085999.1 hypothetical protein E1B28_003522 [Marasmius oreades]